MTEPTIYATFTQPCRHCNVPVQVIDGIRQPHPCPDDGPALVIEIDGPLTVDEIRSRVERAFDDYAALAATEGGTDD